MAVNIVRKSKNEDEEERRKQLLAQMQQNSQARKDAEIQSVKDMKLNWVDPTTTGFRGATNRIGWIGSNVWLGARRSVWDTATAVPQSYAVGLQRGAKQAEQEQSTWDKIKNIGKNYVKAVGTIDPVTRLIYTGTIGREETNDRINQTATQIVNNYANADSTWKKITAIGGGLGSYALGEVNSGVQAFQTGGQQLGQLIGVDKAKQASQALLNFDDKLHEKTDKDAEELAKEGQNYGWLTQKFGEAGQSVGYMAPSIAVNLLTGGGSSGAQAVGLTQMGLASKANTTREAMKQGADLETAERKGVATGTIEAGTELMWGGLDQFRALKGKKGLEKTLRVNLKKAVRDHVKKGTLRTLGKKAVEWGLDIGGEIVEETVSDILGKWIERGTTNPNEDYYTFKDWANTAFTTALSTAVTNAGQRQFNKAKVKAIEGINKVSDKVYNRNSERVENQQSIEEAERVESDKYKENLQGILNNTNMPDEIKSKLQPILNSDATINAEEYNGYVDDIKTVIKANTQQQILQVGNTLNQQYMNIDNQLAELNNIKPENFKDVESRKFYAQQMGKEFSDNTINNILAMYPENRNGNRTVKQYKEIAKEYGKQMALNGLSFDEVRANTVGAWQYYEPNKNITRYDNKEKKNASFDRLNSQVWSQEVYDSYKDTMKTQLQQQQEVLSTQMNDEVARLQDEEDILIDTIDNLKPKASPEQVARTKKLVEDFAKNRGVNVEYNAEVFKNSNEEAFIKDNGNGERTIYINPNADPDTILVKLATHEMFHDTIRTQPHDKLTKLVMDKLQEDENYNMYRQSVIDAYQEQLEGKTQAEQDAIIDEEMTAKYLGEYLGDEQFVQQLVNSTNRTTIQKIVDWIDNRLEQIKNFVTGNKEAEYWRKVRENFEKAYNSKYQGQEGTKFSKDLNILDDGNARFSEDRLNYIIRGSVNDYSDNYAKSYITKITPQQFLDLTTTPEGLQRLEGESTKLNPEQLKGEQQNIFLRVDMETGKVLGHEGRHRMIALRNAGVNNVDIEIIPQQGTYDIENAKDFNYGLYLIGQSMNNGEKGKNVDFTNPITAVTKNNLDKIKQEYLNNNDNKNDIRYSKKTKFDEALQNNIETTNNGKNLLALHNLSEDKLRGILELGGFPMPSIAVTNKYNSNAAYGDITVVFDKNTINPETNSNNKVYSRDAYTPRVPKVVNKLNIDGVRQLAERFNTSTSMLEANEFNDTTLDEAVEKIKWNYDIAENYARDNNIDYEQVYENTADKLPTYFKDSNVQDFIINNDITISKLAENPEMANKLKELIANSGKKEGEPSFIQNIRKSNAERIDKLINNYNEYVNNYGFTSEEIDNGTRMSSMLLEEFRKDFETIKNPETVLNEYETNKNLKAKLENDKDFTKYVKELISPAFEKEKYIRNNKDYYTNSGNPRSFNQLYDSYTVDNIVNIMKELNPTGSEANMFTGISEIAGNVSKRFNSIDEIKQNENMLQSFAEDEYSNMLNSYISRLDDLSEKAVRRKGDGFNYFMVKDGYAQALGNVARRMAEGKSVTTENVIKEMKKDYFDVTSSEANQIIDLLKELQNLPTEYFEAKPQRAVDFSEIDTVVLPSNTSEDIKQALTDRGIKYTEYDSNNENARNDILKSLDEYKFNKKATAFDEYLKANNPNRSGVTIGDLKNLPTKATQPILPTQQSNIANDYIKFRELTEQVKNGDITEEEFDRLSNLDDIQQELKNLGKTDKQVQDIIFELGNLRDNQLNERDINNLINLMGMNAYDREVARNKIAKGETLLPTTNVQATTESLEIPNEQTSIPLGEQVNPSERKQRKTYKSIIESPVMSEEAKKVARKFIGQDTYTPDSNVKQLERADNTIQRLGTEKALDQLESNALEGKTIKADDIAIGNRLIQYYSKIGDSENLQRSIRATAMAGTQAGRSVQAFNLLRHQSPEGMVVWIQNSVDKLNSKMKNGQFDFTPEMQEKILNSTEENLQDNVNEVMKELGQQVPMDLMGKLDAWRYFCMLANPKTHIRNMIGNFAMGLTQQVKSKVAGTIEQVTGQDRTHTSIFEKRSKENINFAKEDIKNVASQLGLGESKYTNPKNQIQQNQRVFRSDAFENTLGKMFNGNDKLLSWEDELGLKKAYVRNLSDYMTANKLNPKTITNEQLQKARTMAVEESLRATFHQASDLASLLNQFEKKNLGTELLVGGLVPFKKTPINVAKSGFSYSPVGLAKTIVYDTVQLRKGNINVNQYIDNLAQGLTGTGIALVGYALAEVGILKAGGDDDKEEKYKKAMGEQPYSIMINGKSYSLDWLAPSGIPLFVGAELNRLVHDTEEKDGETESNVLQAIGRIADAGSSLLNPMSEMSMISGLTSTIQSFSQDSGQALMNLVISPAKSYVGQFVPTAVGQVARTMDTYERDTSSTAKGLLPKAIDQTKNQIINKIPGLREKLPTKKDVWGNEVETQDYFHNAVLPYTEKEIKSNEVDTELNKLYEKTGANVYPNTSLSKTFTYNGTEVRLNNKDYNEIKENYGKTSYKLLKDLTSSKDYKGMTDEQKVKAIKDVYTYANDLNKVNYANKKGIEFETPTDVKQAQAIKNWGGKETDYFKYKGLTDGMNKESEKMTAIEESNLSKTSKKAVYIATVGNDDEFYPVTDIDIDEYLRYKTANIQGQKNEFGETINGTKKQAQLDYINNNITGYENRLLLMGKDYKLNRQQQYDLAQYIYSIDDTGILFKDYYSKNFKVSSDGTVYYK